MKKIKQIEKLDGPWRITFDTNPDDCNLRCIMCEEFSEYSNLKQLRVLQGGPKRRRMLFDQIREVIEQAADSGTLKEIIPSTMGEPLLFRHFEDIIALCHEYSIKLNLTTNGTFPKKSAAEWAETIVPVTSDVKISWNGVSKATAEQIMKGISYEQQVDNLVEFIRVRDRIAEEGGNFCRVTLQVTFLEKNYQEFPDLVRFAAQHGVNRIKGHHLWAHFDEIKEQSMRKDHGTIKRWNRIVRKMREYVEKFPLPSGEKILLDNIYELDPEGGTEEISNQAICPFLGREAWVAWDGRFNPCCAPDNQRKKLGYFGSIKEQSITEIWYSDKYENLVKTYLDNELCRNCNMRRPPEDV